MKRNTDQKKNNNLRGFSLMELMVTIAVLAILAMMAVPAAMALVPRAQLRAEAQNASAIMRQARQKAANTQRPTRVIFDCTPHTADKAEPCRISMQTAAYEDGVFKEWNRVMVGGDAINGHLMRNEIVATNSGGDDLQWVVFMPSSRVFTSAGAGNGYEMVFLSERFKLDPSRAAWYLSVNNSSGRTTLSGRK